MEVEDEEAGNGDLRDEVEPGGRADRPQAAVREHTPRLAGAAAAGNVSNDRSSHDRAREGEAGEEQKRRLEPTSPLEPRQRHGRRCGAEPRRSLPTPERQAAL